MICGLRWPALIVAGVACSPFAALAQAIPGSTAPSHIQERLPPRPQAPVLSAPITVEREQTTQPANADRIHFRLNSVTVTGNHAFGEAALRPLWAGAVGRDIALSQLYAIADAITVKYRNAGYILARAVVPPQRIAGGAVQIRVVEGFIDRVTVKGALPNGKALVDGITAHLTEERPLTAAVLERYLLLLSDLPGVSVQSVVAPSASVPGAATLTVALDQKMVSGFASVDNRGTRYVGPVQATLFGQANSLFGHYNATQMEFLTTPYRPSQLQYGSITHIEPLDSEGTILSLGGSYAASAPGSQLKPLGIDADSLLLTAMLEHPFIRSRSENLLGRISFDYRNAVTDLGDGAVNLYKDRVRALRLGGTYNFLDGWLASNEATLVVSQGIPILHASEDGSTELSRAAGQSDFTKINLDLTRLQPISGPWSVLFGASGQFAFNPLLASEQYGLGGTLYDRAFDPAEMLGDDALAAKIELRYSRAPGWTYLRAYQLYSYFDAGEVWTLRTPVGATEHQGAESFGIGTRFDINERFSGTLEGALPIGRRVAAYAPSGGSGPRFFFSLSARF